MIKIGKIILSIFIPLVILVACNDIMTIVDYKDITDKDVSGDFVDFSDASSYELGELVDVKVSYALPEGSKITAADCIASTCLGDDCKIYNTGKAFSILIKNSEGKNMLLGQALPPTEVLKSMPSKSSIVRNKISYKDCEISCRSTSLSLLLMCFGNSSSVNNTVIIDKLTSHQAFQELVSMFTSRFIADPKYLESINTDKDIKQLINKIVGEVYTDVLNGIPGYKQSSFNGLFTDFRNDCAWNANEPWQWYGDTNVDYITSAPFVALSAKKNINLVNKISIANPTNLCYIADLYNDNDVFLDYFYLDANYSGIEKASNNNASFTNLLKSVNLLKGFDINKTYKLRILKCYDSDFSEDRYKLLYLIHMLEVAESISSVMGSGEYFHTFSHILQRKEIIKKIDNSLINTITSIDISNTSNIHKVFEIVETLMNDAYFKNYLPAEIIHRAMDMLASMQKELLNTNGWGTMILDMKYDYLPLIKSVKFAPSKVEYSFNVAENNVITLGNSKVNVVAVSPVDKSIDMLNPVKIEWGGSADFFDLLLWPANNQNALITIHKTNNKSHLFTNLDFGREYCWQVIAKDKNGVQFNTSVQTFTMGDGVNLPPSVAYAIYPLNMSTMIPCSTRLKWSESVDPNPKDKVKYKLKYWIENETTPSEFIVESTFLDVLLEVQKKYLWQVIAIDDKGLETPSDIYTFSTEENIAPSVPTLKKPLNNSTDLVNYLTLSWNVSTDANGDTVTYDVIINSNKENKIISTSLTNLEIKLDHNTQYTWSIIAKDNNGGKTESETWTFKTGIKTD